MANIRCQSAAAAVKLHAEAHFIYDSPVSDSEFVFNKKKTEKNRILQNARRCEPRYSCFVLLLFDLLNGNRDEDVVIFISQFVFATVFRPIFISSRILCSFCIWRTHIDINIRYFPITIDLCVSLALYRCFSSFFAECFLFVLEFWRGMRVKTHILLHTEQRIKWMNRWRVVDAHTQLSYASYSDWIWQRESEYSVETFRAMNRQRQRIVSRKDVECYLLWCCHGFRPRFNLDGSSVVVQPVHVQNNTQ